MSGGSTKKSNKPGAYLASEEVWQALFEQAADGIFIAKKTGEFVDVNQRGCDMVGYTRAEMLKLSLVDLISPENLATDPLQLDAMNSGESLLKERQICGKDGRCFPAEISARILADGAILGIVRDISERKQAEEKLRESNDRFQLLAESSLTGIYLIQDGRFRYVNPAMAHIFGYQVEEITDVLGPTDLVFDDDRSLVNENLRRRVDGEQESINYEFRGLTKDKTVIDVEVHGRRIEFGGKMGVIGTLVEVTKRKRAEEALRTSEERLQLALDVAELGLWDWKITTGELTWSQECLAMYGLPLDTDITYAIFLQTIHPEDRERIDRALNRAVETCSSYEEHKRVIWPDGSIHWTLSRGQVYCDARGTPVRMTGVSFDISKLKQAEAEHQVHVWFLESLDKVNRAMQGTNDLQQMMINVLDSLLTIFNCDRAWLVYPCDPEAATWQSMMERTVPEYPGVIPIGVKLPLDPVGAAVYKVLRESSGPVQFRPGASHPVPQVIAEVFQVQSFMANALYPKVGQPWSFGLHQCSYPRVWTQVEERLLQAIGWRLADSLTSLLSYRNLRQSEHRLEEAERIAHVGWWDRNYEENRISLSDEACRIFGIPFKVQDYFLDDWYEQWQVLVHPEDRQRTAVAAENALQGDPRYDLEYRIIRPSGEMRVVQSQGDVTWDDAGRPLRMFGIMQDITELRQVEAELRDNRETALQFSQQLAVLHEVTNQLSLAESSDDLYRLAVQLGKLRLGFDRASIWFVDLAANLLRGSYGTDEKGELRDERTAVITIERRGLAWEVLSHKEPKAYVEYLPLYDHLGNQVGEGQNAIAGLWDGDKVIGVICVDNLFTQKPITENWLEVLKLYATSLGYLVTRKRAQEAQARLLVQIQEQAQQVHNIMDTVPEGVVLLGKNLFVTLTNPVARQYLAQLAPNWENSALNALGSVALPELLTSPPKGLWHEVKSNDLVFEVIARPIENSPSNGGWVLVLRDVTQERDIQNRVQRQDRLVAVGQMAAGIAHDFNNILTVIRLYAQLILRTVEIPKHAEERLNTIEQQTERATDLIQQILDFSRQSMLERQSFDLLPFIKRLVKLLDRTLPDNVAITFEHTNQAFHILADPSRIQQIVMNLAVNARDAMPEGGELHMTLKQVQIAEKKSLSLNDLPPGPWVLLEVTDNGTGIDPEVLAHIFEPFFTTKQVGEGTGLGLAQVYGIMQQHEGCIDVVSQVGRGTTFSLYFPALGTVAGAAVTPDQSLLTLGQGQTLLLVEDNQPAREALLGSLSLLNYEVVAAANGRQALEILAEKEACVDLVLSDVVMPEMGGIALFHAMHEQYPGIPVVLLTGHAMNNDMENLKLLGLSGWMPKPPDLAALSHLLADVLADSQA